MFSLVLALPRRLKWVFALAVVLGAAEASSWRFAWTVYQRLIDALPGAHAFRDVLPLFAVYGALYAAQYVLIYLEVWPLTVLATGVQQWAKLQAMRKIARIDYLAWQRLGTGTLVQTIENGADAVYQVVNGFWLHLMRSLLPSVVISLVIIAHYDARIAWLVVAAMLVAIPLSRVLFRRAEALKGRFLDRQEEFSRRAVRAFMELVTFRVRRRFAGEIRHAEGLSDDIVRTQGRMRLIQEVGYQAFAAFILAVELGVIALQIGRIVAGTSTVGTLIALVAMVGHAISPVHDFYGAYLAWKLHRVTLDRFDGFLALPDDANAGKAAALRLTCGEVALEGVTFGYEGRPLLDDVSLTLGGGAMTALVGATGAGKSTVAKLALGLLKPGSGRVLVDGQDLGGVELDTYYGRIAYLPQEPAVFDGTIRENLVFDQPAADAELMGVLDRVRLGELVRALPKGLDAEIGERGVTLSGGERQRLALARAFLSDPALVVMDEPTSALDSLTEEVVTGHMKELFAGRTILVIAHRLQTVREADRILVLEGGRVIQDGRFDALVAAPGRFRELWEAQTREASPTFP